MRERMSRDRERAWAFRATVTSTFARREAGLPMPSAAPATRSNRRRASVRRYPGNECLCHPAPRPRAGVDQRVREHVRVRKSSQAAVGPGNLTPPSTSRRPPRGGGSPSRCRAALPASPCGAHAGEHRDLRPPRPPNRSTPARTRTQLIGAMDHWRVPRSARHRGTSRAGPAGIELMTGFRSRRWRLQRHVRVGDPSIARS